MSEFCNLSCLRGHASADVSLDKSQVDREKGAYYLVKIPSGTAVKDLTIFLI